MKNCPDGAESEIVQRKPKKKVSSRSTDKLTLRPARFKDALKALLETPPPPTSKKAKG